ncbi:aminoacyltransferase [Thermodesulfobacterium sp. TA1]|uniref:aminoacyltransferase n=1 Tax=Thermodesulfobacterium sp. TA1 TaxID=2234087 RepID=UPI001232E051|nr:aminoacyltransferase [Thermodesulfobacterium sp. TA1]QER41849.1 aminoacyltransferase [Thermodesulfobacterium sp. TA1]
MGIVYDEVWFTTSREIKVCEENIKNLTQKLEALEKEFNLKAHELDEKDVENNPKLKKLWQTYKALEREKQRLTEFKAFMEKG